MHKIWYSDQRKEYVLTFDASHMCVAEVEDYIRQAIAWHNIADLVFHIKVGAKIYTASDCLAWECPTHKTIENLALLPLCYKDKTKILHFKFMLPSQARGRDDLSIKFYPDRGAPSTPLTTIDEGCDTPHLYNGIYIRKTSINIESSGNVQDPTSQAAVVLRAMVMDYRRSNPICVMKLRYDDIAHRILTFDNVPIINHDEILEWVQRVIGNMA